MKKMLFILNPCSGRGQIRNKLADILDIFIKSGYEVTVHLTQGPLDARNVVRDRGEGMDLIVCSGGDGTLNETASGVMCLENRPPIGYIPAGSTNDFAVSLGIPKNIMAAAHNAVEGALDYLDIGCFCKDRYFVYIAAFGAFTDVSYLTPQDKKNLLGHQAYMLESVKRLTGIKSYRLRVESGDLALEGEFIFGMVTNSIRVGGFKGLVSQDVALNDGEFEVLLIRSPKTPIEFSNIISCLLMKEEQNEYVHKFRAKSLRVIPSEPLDWVLDGEFGGTRETVEIKNLRRKMAIVRSRAAKQ